jgi:hypothetical protein
MGLGFPAITLSALTKEGDPMSLTPIQASWFGKCEFEKLSEYLSDFISIERF